MLGRLLSTTVCRRRLSVARSAAVEPQWSQRFEELKRAGSDGAAVLRELVSLLPKAELHLHLDGSLRPATLAELFKASPAAHRLPALPVQTAADGSVHIGSELLKPHYDDLGDYLRVFAYTTAALQSPAALRRAASELIVDQARDGVRYVEVRFAPQLHMNDDTPFFDLADASRSDPRFDAVLSAVNDGLRDGCDAVNGYTVPGQVPMTYGIIVCGLRSVLTDDGRPLCRYYADIVDAATKSSPSTTAASLASLRLAVDKRAFLARRPDVPVVALDLAGAELNNCASAHRAAYELADEQLWGRTVHAGEADGLLSILQALRSCKAHRLGHGFHLFTPELVDADTVQALHCRSAQDAIDKCVRYLAHRRVHIEVCLTSNEQTMPHLRGNLRDHAFRRMLDEHLSVSLCTDNTLVSATTLTNEYVKAIDHFDLSLDQLVDLIMAGYSAAFYPGSFRDKIAYTQLAADNMHAVLAHYLEPLPY